MSRLQLIYHWAVSRNNIYLGVSCLCGRRSSSLHYCHTSSNPVKNNVPVGQQGGWKDGSWITGHWSSFCACLRPLTSLRGSHTAAKDFIKTWYLLKSDDILTLIYNMIFFYFEIFYHNSFLKNKVFSLTIFVVCWNIRLFWMSDFLSTWVISYFYVYPSGYEPSSQKSCWIWMWLDSLSSTFYCFV